MPDDARSKIREDMSRAISGARQRTRKKGKPRIAGKQRTKIENEVARNLDTLDELTGGR